MFDGLVGNSADRDLLSSLEWRKRYLDGAIKEGDSRHVMMKLAPHGHVPMQVKEDSDYVVEVYITGDDERDLDGDLISVKGWDWQTAYFSGRDVGPFLWGHDRSLVPIGECDRIVPVGAKLKARQTFLTDEEYGYPEGAPNLARQVRLSVAKKLLKTSVGFVPVELAWNDKAGGFDIAKQIGVEVSWVPVASYSGAWVVGKALGLDLSFAYDWAIKILDGDDEHGVWIPRDQLEITAKELGKPISYFTFRKEPRMAGTPAGEDEVPVPKEEPTKEPAETAPTAPEVMVRSPYGCDQGFSGLKRYEAETKEEGGGDQQLYWAVCEKSGKPFYVEIKTASSPEAFRQPASTKSLQQPPSDSAGSEAPDEDAAAYEKAYKEAYEEEMLALGYLPEED